MKKVLVIGAALSGISVSKLLNKKGLSVAFDNKQILFFNDTVNNFPILVCKGPHKAHNFIVKELNNIFYMS